MGQGGTETSVNTPEDSYRVISLTVVFILVCVSPGLVNIKSL